MGYYTQQNGTVTIAARDEAVAVEALKALNHNHEDKRGGSWPKTGDPFADSWYSWLPPRFHEDKSIRTVGDVLEMLGYEVRATPGTLNLYTVSYDTKTGQEDVFLNRLSDFAHIQIDVVGEDGSRWMWSNKGAGTTLTVTYARTEWREPVPVVAELERQRRIEASVGGRV
jgi:hypothetical protein